MSNTFTIVACGDSAKDWTPNGYCLGVNDAGKWGKPLDGLLICNRPATFSRDRLDIIKATNPKDFYCNKRDWQEYFPKWKKVRLHTWAGVLHEWKELHAYSSNTSPLIAITLAYNLGAKEIILWGVDFRNHHMYNDSNLETYREVDTYCHVINQMREKGCRVYIGASGSVFDKILPGYDKA